MREVDLLSAIQTCQRHNKVIPRDYVLSFTNGVIEEYVKQTTELNQFSNRKFAILILRNASLTTNTMRTVTFQLRTNAVYTERDDWTDEVNLIQLELDCIKEKLSDGVGPLVIKCSMNVL